MLTAEQVAREAAGALVRVELDPDRDTHPYDLMIGAHLDWSFSDGKNADEIVAEIRPEVAAAVLAAIERWAQQRPPGGLSEARLGQIRAVASAPPPGNGEYRWKDDLLAERARLADLLAHVDHLTRVLGDCAADGSLSAWREVYDRAYAQGAAAQHAADVESAHAAVRRHQIGTAGYHAALDAAASVGQTSLVTQEETTS